MVTVLESLNTALHKAFTADERVLLLGEDVLDPYGGAFKVSRGLSTAFPGRVLTTPVSEAGMVGLAAGMAMRGLRPVVEIMFGDFITLAADQLINHAAKFQWMYNDQVRVPLVVRTPMGGRRGYGPTHSQSLEKLFLGVPGLNVLAPTALGDPGELLRRTILEGERPTLFVENKLLYLAPVLAGNPPPDLDGRTIPGPAPAYVLTVQGAPSPAVTLAAYGYMADLAVQAMVRLAYEAELFCELVVPTRLSPVDAQPLIESVQRTRRLLAIEEGSLALGWGAEAVAIASEKLSPHLLAARRLAARNLPIPASGRMEEAVLPGVEDIVQIVKMMV